MDDSAVELYEVMPRANWSRRGFLVTSLGTGFALAAGPISAQTITTDTKGLDTAEVMVPTADGDMPAYRAMPATGGPFATILVVQEIFGVHEHIKDICRRLAKAGYFAIAPELYARQGDPSKYEDIPRLVAEVVSKVPDSQVIADLDATVVYARSTGKGDPNRLAITGFCWGGRPVWLYAAHNSRLKAAVSWYGPIDRPRTDLQPKYPIDLAADLKCPVLGLYGGADQGIPLESVDRMAAASKATARPVSSRSIPARRTLSTPTIGRATAPTQPRTPGRGCSPSLSNTT